MECEDGNSLAFLDTTVHRKNNKFVTSVYRKLTFTGLGMSYYSYCCDNYVQNKCHQDSSF